MSVCMNSVVTLIQGICVVCVVIKERKNNIIARL